MKKQVQLHRQWVNFGHAEDAATAWNAAVVEDHDHEAAAGAAEDAVWSDTAKLAETLAGWGDHLMLPVLRAMGLPAAGQMAVTCLHLRASTQRAFEVLEAERPPWHVYFCGGVSAADGSQFAPQRFMPAVGHWDQVADLNGPSRCGCAMAAVAGELYVLGGVTAGGYDTDIVDRLDLSAGAWVVAPPLRMARTGCAAAAIESRLYAVGGSAKGLELPYVEYLDVCKETEQCCWQPLPRMLEQRYACTAVSWRGNLHVFGGCSRGLSLAAAEVLASNGVAPWQALCPPPTPRYGCAAAVTFGKIYIAGGYQGGRPLAHLERFDPAEGHWDVMPPMPTGRKWCTAVASAGLVYVFGGFDGRQALATVERFDVTSRQWEQLAPMPLPQERGAAAGVRIPATMMEETNRN